MYLEKLNKEQLLSLEKCLSKACINSNVCSEDDKVTIEIDDRYKDEKLYNLCINGKIYTFLGDFDVGRYNEHLHVEYCCFMAHLFKDEYIRDSKNYLSKRLLQSTTNLNQAIEFENKNTHGLIKDINYHSNVLSALDAEYSLIMAPDKSIK